MRRRWASGKTHAPLIPSGYSRLAIDPNRPPESPDLIPVLSAWIPVRRNHGPSPLDCAERVGALIQPYRRAIYPPGSVLALDFPPSRLAQSHEQFGSFTPSP